jgi:transcriptional regulator with XRE-family HTH domain
VTSKDQRVAIGRAIAEQRRRHGLSQAELARLLGRPDGWVSLMERGLVQAEPLPVLEAVASALGTPLPVRHGGGPRPAGGTGERGAVAASALRLVLSDEGRPRGGPGGRPGATALRAGADRSWALTQAGCYGELVDLLRTLLPELSAALRAAPGPRERAGLHELIAPPATRPGRRRWPSSGSTRARRRPPAAPCQLRGGRGTCRWPRPAPTCSRASS